MLRSLNFNEEDQSIEMVSELFLCISINFAFSLFLQLELEIITNSYQAWCMDQPFNASEEFRALYSILYIHMLMSCKYTILCDQS